MKKIVLILLGIFICAWVTSAQQNKFKLTGGITPTIMPIPVNLTYIMNSEPDNTPPTFEALPPARFSGQNDIIDLHIQNGEKKWWERNKKKIIIGTVMTSVYTTLVILIINQRSTPYEICYGCGGTALE